MDVGSGWLIVYDDPTGRHTVVVARDGSFSPPKAVSGNCAMVDFARSATTALLTDSCNHGTLFDLAGQTLTEVTFPKPTEITSPCWNLNIAGGQLAFTGIDYLVMFSPGLLGDHHGWIAHVSRGRDNVAKSRVARSPAGTGASAK